MNLDNFKKWPHFSEDEISRAAQVLRSGKINRWTGPENGAFEAKLAKEAGSEYAIALANGTLALELALAGIGLEPGDEVIVPCRTFMATASAVAVRGGVPIVADVDPVSQNVTAETVRPLVTDKTRALIVVHHAGWPCEMDEIMALAEEKNLRVIEDCAQAHGARYKGRPVGSIGHVGAWSFCQDKIITTGGEGGAVTVNDRETYLKMWAYKDHGRSFDAVYNRPHAPGFRWLLESFGSNFRLTEMQAALGSCGLDRLPEWGLRRACNAKIFNDAFEGLPCVRTAAAPAHMTHANYKYYCFLRPEALKGGATRDSVLDEINALGIPAFSGTCWNISAEKCFLDKGWGRGEADLPNAAALRDTSLMLLIHPTLEEADVAGAAAKISEVLLANCK